MKKTILTLSLLALIPAQLPAAISLVAGTAVGPHFFIGNVGVGGSKWNTVPAGATANVYWDADNDMVLGETVIGENAGNAADLGFTINIVSGTSYFFAMQGFDSPGANQGADFDIHNTDSSIQRVLVLSGDTTSFSDSNGDQWQVTYTFNESFYGDLVNNIDHTPGGATQDHQGVLTFTQVPEPSATFLLGIGGLALILRRRK